MPPAARSALPSSYLFIASRADGRRSLGLRRAKDTRHLADQLRRERLVPLRTWRLPGSAGASASRLALKDQAEIHTQLAQLLSRGVPLVEALEVTAGAVTPAAAPKINRMREQVSSGMGFADACSYTGAFDRVTVAVYRASERTGDLAGAAAQLATTCRRQLAISSKAITLAIYPAIVLSISIIVSIIMLTIVVPMIGRSLKQNGADLPWFSEMMIGAGTFMRDNALFLLLGLAGLIVFAIFARRPILAALAAVARKLPFVREVVTAQESARFFTVMAAMTKCGVPLADALGVAVGAVSHPDLRAQLTTLRARLIDGGLLRSLIENVSALPMPTRRLLVAADRSGDMQTVFEGLAEDMAQEVDRRSARLLAALEPALIVFMFLLIGSLLLSIMLPMMAATSKMLT